MSFKSISNSVISLHRAVRTEGGDLVAETLTDGTFSALLTITDGWSTYEKVNELNGQPVQWFLVRADALTLDQAQQIAAFQFDGRRYEIRPNEVEQSGAPDYWRFAAQPIERI